MRHLPVLLKESIRLLEPENQGWWIDATVGGGGHTAALLEATAPNGKVLGIDRDEAVLTQTAKRLASYGPRLTLEHGNYRDMETIARDLDIVSVRGVLMDLGVSSFQLDEQERGFSFQHNGPLDMRMDKTQPVTAESIINHADEKTLADIFYTYGEERRSRQLARLIVRHRPVQDTAQLAALAKRAVGPSGKIHPATRAFQALRIAVNDELGCLEKGLVAAENLIAPQGHLVVISFHSLEDRIVKQWMRRPAWERTVKKVVLPEEEELLHNPRARSAKCRAAKRVESAEREMMPKGMNYGR